MNYLEKGIDISHWQGNIDFRTVKNNGYNFVMIKAGGSDDGYYKDSNFETYYLNAKLAGMKVGTYYFTGYNFFTELQGQTEAKKFLELIKGKTFEYPVCVDVEAVSTIRGRDNITTATIAFCKELEKAGYYATIYASDISGFKSRMNIDRLDCYDKWVAKYSSNPPTYVKNYGIWQYGGSQNYICSPKVQGVSSTVCDQNYSYKDYNNIIKNAGLNGFKKGQELIQEEKTKYYKITTEKMTTGDKNTIENKLKELDIDFKTEEC